MASTNSEKKRKVVDRKIREFYEEYRDFFISKYGERNFVPSAEILRDIDSVAFEKNYRGGNVGNHEW